jgi:aminoglycoside 6'-N-acetyltransferase I
MLIRPVEPEDYDEWLRMRLLLWPDHSEEELRVEMVEIVSDRTNATYVAVRPDGSLGGFIETSQRKYAEGCRTSPVGYIEGWYVDPDLRGRGIGRQLVSAAESWAKASGLSEMASDCELDNQVSLDAHLALGYEEVERLIQFKKSLVDNKTTEEEKL